RPPPPESRRSRTGAIVGVAAVGMAIAIAAIGWRAHQASERAARALTPDAHRHAGAANAGHATTQAASTVPAPTQPAVAIPAEHPSRVPQSAAAIAVLPRPAESES